MKIFFISFRCRMLMQFRYLGMLNRYEKRPSKAFFSYALHRFPILGQFLSGLNDAKLPDRKHLDRNSLKRQWHGLLRQISKLVSDLVSHRWGVRVL